MSPKAQTTVAPVGRSSMAEATMAITLTSVPNPQAMASRLATGKRVVPRLLKNKPVVPQTQLAVDQDHLDFIRTAMAGVVDHGLYPSAMVTEVLIGHPHDEVERLSG